MGLDILAVTASVSIRAEPRGAPVKMASSDDQHDAAGKGANTIPRNHGVSVVILTSAGKIVKLPPAPDLHNSRQSGRTGFCQDNRKEAILYHLTTRAP